MATTLKVKIIERDNIQELEKSINDFLAGFSGHGGYSVIDVEIEAEPLFNGNKIYVATILYDSATFATATVKLFEKDSSAELENIMNVYITAAGTDPSAVKNIEIVMKQGNNSYVGMAGYNFSSGSSAGGNTFEDGTFNFSFSSGGNSITGNVNGDATKFAYNPGTKVMTFTTAKKLKLWQALVYYTQNPNSFSEGRSDGTIQVCNGSPPTVFSSGNVCMELIITGDGWTGIITNILANSFDIALTQFGNPLNMTGKFHLIEG